jgi:hypothetical protein
MLAQFIPQHSSKAVSCYSHGFVRFVSRITPQKINPRALLFRPGPA